MKTLVKDWRHAPWPRVARFVSMAWLGSALASGPEGGGAPTVQVVRMRREAVTRFVALPGTLRPNQQVVLQARVPGFVTSMAVDRGDRVRAGQVVAEVEVPELMADKARAAAEMEVAAREVARLRRARARDVALVTEEEWDAAEGRMQVSRARLEGVEAMIGHARIKAPFDGVVVERHVDPGSYLAASTGAHISRVVTVADASSLRVVVPVPEAEARHVRVGQPVQVLVEGGPAAGFDARVSRHAGVVDEATRCLVVEADLARPDPLLMAGLFATVRVGVEQRTNAWVLPSEAVLHERSGASVFVVEDGTCRKRPLKLGIVEGTLAEVAGGLSQDVRVIVPARTAPGDGKSVVMQEAR